MDSKTCGLALVVLAVLACGVGCGGGGNGGAGSSSSSGSGATCGKVTGCGGDVVGTWTVQSMCFDAYDAIFPDLQAVSQCAKVVTGGSVKASGSYTFDKSGNVMTDLTFSVDVDTLWTADCLSALNMSKTAVDDASCAAIEASNQGQAGVAGIACKVEKTGCSCLITSSDVGGPSSSVYSVKGSTLTLGSNDGAYCVKGDTLSIVRTNAGLTGTLVLKKK